MRRVATSGLPVYVSAGNRIVHASLGRMGLLAVCRTRGAGHIVNRCRLPGEVAVVESRGFDITAGQLATELEEGNRSHAAH